MSISNRNITIITDKHNKFKDCVILDDNGNFIEKVFHIIFYPDNKPVPTVEALGTETRYVEYSEIKVKHES